MAERPQSPYIPDVPDLEVLERRYEFIRELGRGGMAAVHLARRRGTDDLVAIKAICRRYADDEESLARFAREARTLITFDHPNIVRTLAVESVDERILAIVMEYMHGRTLRQELRMRRRLDYGRTVSILRDVAGALAHAHARGVVHRDVKPDNIFLDEDAGRARLADFGIARAFDTDVELTLSGMALGTPAYMSPEQIDGEALDGRSDMYSLGVVGWEMLAGQRPWDGESLYGMIYRQKHDLLPDLAHLRPDIPVSLLQAIEGALRKQASQRWSTAGDFIDALNGIASELPLERLPSRAKRAGSDFATIRFRRIAASLPSDELPPHMSEPAAEAAEVEEVPLDPEHGYELQPAADAEPFIEIDEPSVPDILQRLRERAVGPPLDPFLGGTPPWDVSYPHEMIEPEPVLPRRPMVLALLVLVATLGVGAVSDRRDSDDPRALIASSSTGSLDALGMPALPGGLAADADRAPGSPPIAMSRRDSLAACTRTTLAHQRLCAGMLVASTDANVGTVFGQVITALAAARARPDSLRRVRVGQRAWQIERDIECTDRIPERNGERWGIARSECVAAISSERVEELRGELARMRGEVTR